MLRGQKVGTTSSRVTLIITIITKVTSVTDEHFCESSTQKSNLPPKWLRKHLCVCYIWKTGHHFRPIFSLFKITSDM